MSHRFSYAVDCSSAVKLKVMVNALDPVPESEATWTRWSYISLWYVRRRCHSSRLQHLAYRSFSVQLPAGCFLALALLLSWETSTAYRNARQTKVQGALLLHCCREGCAQGEKGKRKRETWGESQIICNGKSLFYVFMRLTCVLQRVVAEQTNLRLPSAPPLHSLWSFRRLSDRIQQQQQQHAGCPSPSSRRALSSGPHCSEWG